MKLTDFITISYVIAQQDYDYVGFIGVDQDGCVTFRDTMLTARHFGNLETAKEALKDISEFREYEDGFKFSISEEVDIEKLSIIKCETNFIEV